MDLQRGPRNGGGGEQKQGRDRTEQSGVSTGFQAESESWGPQDPAVYFTDRREAATMPHRLALCVVESRQMTAGGTGQ